VLLRPGETAPTAFEAFEEPVRRETNLAAVLLMPELCKKSIEMRG
jgi:hypothetical protein